ncbi:MAG: sugar phosphate nucleotidyltransferase [Acidimicrobiales bacterium]
MKGVVLAGGTGSRLHPLTRITNKHLLPIYDRPMIQWAIEAVVNAGITEVMLVTGGAHAGDFVPLLGNGHAAGLDVLTYGYQERPGGIADALGLAQRFADGQPVLVMLADNIVERSIAPTVAAFRKEPTGARVLLSPVAEPQHLGHLGVPEFGPDGRITRVIEKPEDPPSAYAVTGVYCYDASVFSVIPTLVPSARGELEIADVNNHYASLGTLRYDVLEGFWGDAGESIDAYYAVNDFVRANGANKG